MSFKNYIFGFGVEGTGVYGFQNGTFLKLSFFENFPVCRVLRSSPASKYPEMQDQ